MLEEQVMQQRMGLSTEAVFRAIRAGDATKEGLRSEAVFRAIRVNKGLWDRATVKAVG
jgi:hypothetical protein